MFIRQATPEDAEEAAKLICMAWEECACVLAGTTNEKEIQKVIKAFYQQPHNILSYQNVEIAEGEKGVAGLVLAYPSDYYEQLNKLVAEKLPSIYQSDMTDFQSKVIPLFKKREAKPGEYYIDSLAVYPQYRSCGVGSRLLKVAHLKSRKRGIKKISLIVKMGNKAALNLYKKLGYSIRGKLKKADNNYLSMIKINN